VMLALLVYGSHASVAESVRWLPRMRGVEMAPALVDEPT
jgi:hypothetical protein